MSYSTLKFKKIHTHPAVRHDDSACIVKFAKVVTNVTNVLNTDSTWIHIRRGIRRRAKFENERTFSATERTVVAAYARSLTTERR